MEYGNRKNSTFLIILLATVIWHISLFFLLLIKLNNESRIYSKNKELLQNIIIPLTQIIKEDKSNIIQKNKPIPVQIIKEQIPNKSEEKKDILPQITEKNNPLLNRPSVRAGEKIFSDIDRKEENKEVIDKEKIENKIQNKNSVEYINKSESNLLNKKFKDVVNINTEKKIMKTPDLNKIRRKILSNKKYPPLLSYINNSHSNNDTESLFNSIAGNENSPFAFNMEGNPNLKMNKNQAIYYKYMSDLLVLLELTFRTNLLKLSKKISGEYLIGLKIDSSGNIKFNVINSKADYNTDEIVLKILKYLTPFKPIPKILNAQILGVKIHFDLKDFSEYKHINWTSY